MIHVKVWVTGLEEAQGILGQYIQHHTKHRGQDSSQVSCVINWPSLQQRQWVEHVGVVRVVEDPAFRHGDQHPVPWSGLGETRSCEGLCYFSGATRLCRREMVNQ